MYFYLKNEQIKKRKLYFPVLPHSSLQSSSSLLKSSLMGVVTILGMGDTAAMLRSVLASSSLSPTGTKCHNDLTSNVCRAKKKSSQNNKIINRTCWTNTESAAFNTGKMTQFVLYFCVFVKLPGIFFYSFIQIMLLMKFNILCYFNTFNIVHRITAITSLPAVTQPANTEMPSPSLRPYRKHYPATQTSSLKRLK